MENTNAPSEEIQQPQPPLPVGHSFEHMPVHHTSFNRDEPRVFHLNGTPVLVTPPNWSRHQLDGLAFHQPYHRPAFIDADVAAQDNDSFHTYFLRYTNNDELLTAKRSETKVTCTFDYHSKAAAGMRKHKVRRVYARSAHLLAWQNAAARQMTQKGFATFLQDRLSDVAPEQRAALAESVSAFKLAVNMTYSREDNLHNGDTRFTFIKESQQSGATLPELIRIRVPVFEFCQIYDINVRVSYTVDANQGKVAFGIELVEIDDFIDVAFLEEVRSLGRELSREIMIIS